MAVNDKGGIRIPIVTYFSDKGIKAASSSLMGLETAATKLAKTFGVTLGTAAIGAFGKKSLDAFAADQKAAAQLTATLYNLGLAYKGMNVNQFISDLQDATGVMDDQLRPAMQSLVTYTLDYAKAQKLLNTALNVSVATGKDLQSVAEALGNAYNGNYKGLVGLKIGITQAEAKTESFAQLMQQLNDQFKDAAFMDTYQQRLNRIKVATADAIEYIGQGIAGALSSLTAGGDITKTMENIRNFGKIISEEIIGFAAGIKQLFKDISEIPVVKLILMAVGGAIKGIDKLLGISKAAKQDIANFNKKMAADQAKADAKAIAAAKQQDALNKKLRAQALADQKKLNAEKEKQAKLDALALKYKQASSIFDMEQVELAAASMSKQTAEDYARIKLKQDLLTLQDAIQAGDLKAAEAAAKVVEEDYKRVWAYQAQNIALGIQNGTIQNIQNAAKLIPQDMNLINLGNLKSALDYINEMLAKLANMPKGTTTTVTGGGAGGNGGSSGASGGTGGGVTITNVYPPRNPNLFEGSGVYDYKSPYSYGLGNPNLMSNSGVYNNKPNYSFGYGNPNLLTSSGVYGQNVTVTIVDNTSGLIDVVTDATQQGSANGINTRVLRNTPNLAW